MITIRHIENTINNKAESPIREVAWEGRVLAELAPETALSCIVNGRRVLKTDAEWQAGIPADGAILVFVTADEGQGGIGIAQVIVGIALIALGPVGWGIIAGAWATTLGASLIVGGLINIGVSLLAPSASALIQSGGGGKQASATYGFDEIQNRAQNNATRPVVYGEHLVGGNIINTWRETVGGGIRNHDQTIFVLIALSEGPIQSVGQYTTNQNKLTLANMPEGMQINGIDASKLKETEVSFRLGALTQTACPDFERIVTEYAQEFRLKDSTTVFEWRSRSEINAFMVNVFFPRGLFKVDALTGELELRNTFVKLQVYELDGTTLVAEETGIELLAKTSSPVYATLRIGDDVPLPTAQYIIRVTRTKKESDETDKVDEMGVTTVNEVQNIAQTYPGLAVLGLKIHATEQISGGSLRVLTMIKGRKVRTSFASETESYSKNPAWQTRDALTNKRYGLGNVVNDDDIDEDSFEEFAEYCDEEIPQYTGSATMVARAQFDGVFDSAAAGIEAIARIPATARGTIVKFGDTLKFKIDKQKSAVQAFGMGNTRKGSLTVGYINPSERYNAIEVAFLNASKAYIQDQVISELPDLDETIDSVRKSAIQIYGVTRLPQARWLSDFYLRSEQSTFKAITFEAGIDAVAMEPGDVFIFNHDMPDWSRSGRIIGLDAGNIVMDQTVAFEAGKIYQYMERDNETDARLTFDFEATGDLSALPFAPLYGATGAIGRIYAVGEKATVSQKFLAMRIQTNTRGLFRTVDAIQYVDEVYGDAAEPIESDAYLPEPCEAPDSATALAVVETVDDDYVALLTVSWTAAAGAVRYAVYARPKGRSVSWTKQGETTTTSLAFTTTERLGVTLEIAVATINADSCQTALAVAPTVNHTIEREDEFNGDTLIVFPDQVENLALTVVSGNEYDLDWDAVAGADGYSARICGWSEGSAISGSGTNRTIYASRVPHKISVRALEGYVYSGPNAFVETDAVQYGAYDTEYYSAFVDFDDSAGAFGNCAPVDWFGRRGLLTTDTNASMNYTSPVIDLEDEDFTHVSLDVRVLAYVSKSIESSDLWNSMQHQSFAGLLNKVYTDWEIYIETSNNGTTWNSYSMKSKIGRESTVKKAQYFRVRFTGKSEDVLFGGEDGPTRRRDAKVLIESMNLALYRTA